MNQKNANQFMPLIESLEPRLLMSGTDTVLPWYGPIPSDAQAPIGCPGAVGRGEEIREAELAVLNGPVSLYGTANELFLQKGIAPGATLQGDVHICAASYTSASANGRVEVYLIGEGGTSTLMGTAPFSFDHLSFPDSVDVSLPLTFPKVFSEGAYSCEVRIVSNIGTWTSTSPGVLNIESSIHVLDAGAAPSRPTIGPKFDPPVKAPGLLMSGTDLQGVDVYGGQFWRQPQPPGYTVGLPGIPAYPVLDVAAMESAPLSFYGSCDDVFTEHPTVSPAANLMGDVWITGGSYDPASADGTVYVYALANDGSSTLLGQAPFSIENLSSRDSGADIAVPLSFPANLSAGTYSSEVCVKSNVGTWITIAESEFKIATPAAVAMSPEPVLASGTERLPEDLRLPDFVSSHPIDCRQVLYFWADMTTNSIAPVAAPGTAGFVEMHVFNGGFPSSGDLTINVFATSNSGGQTLLGTSLFTMDSSTLGPDGDGFFTVPVSLPCDMYAGQYHYHVTLASNAYNYSCDVDPTDELTVARVNPMPSHVVASSILEFAPGHAFFQKLT